MAYEFEQRPLRELPSRVPDEVVEWLDDKCSPGYYDLIVAYGDDEVVTQAVLCVAGDGGCEVTVWQDEPLTEADKDEVASELIYDADGHEHVERYQ